MIHRPALNRPQIFQLGEEINQSGGGTIGECPGGCQVEGKSFAQQGAGQSPRLVSLGQEAPNGEHRQGQAGRDLGQKSGFAYPGGTDDQHRYRRKA